MRGLWILASDARSSTAWRNSTARIATTLSDNAEQFLPLAKGGLRSVRMAVPALACGCSA
jgi:hypothetical protein